MQIPAWGPSPFGDQETARKHCSRIVGQTVEAAMILVTVAVWKSPISSRPPATLCNQRHIEANRRVEHCIFSTISQSWWRVANCKLQAPACKHLPACVLQQWRGTWDKPRPSFMCVFFNQGFISLLPSFSFGSASMAGGLHFAYREDLRNVPGISDSTNTAISALGKLIARFCIVPKYNGREMRAIKIKPQTVSTGLQKPKIQPPPWFNVSNIRPKLKITVADRSNKIWTKVPAPTEAVLPRASNFVVVVFHMGLF
jgi:hypothetical protein